MANRSLNRDVQQLDLPLINTTRLFANQTSIDETRALWLSKYYSQSNKIEAAVERRESIIAHWFPPALNCTVLYTILYHAAVLLSYQI